MPPLPPSLIESKAQPEVVVFTAAGGSGLSCNISTLQYRGGVGTLPTVSDPPTHQRTPPSSRLETDKLLHC